MLNFNTPEIEKFLASAGTGITPSATQPSLYGTAPVAKSEHSATQEQQEYAMGFELALKKLHNEDCQETQSGPSSSAAIPDQHQMQATSDVPVSMAQMSSHEHYVTNDAYLGDAGGYSLTQLTNRPNEQSAHDLNPSVGGHHLAQMANYAAMSSMSGHHHYEQHIPVHQIKVEKDLHHEGSTTASNYTPPLSPIDMANQERIKLERKRLRNRIAASKCRKRKLDKIAKLEDKVKHLKGENGDLSSAITRSRDSVMRLKQELITHVKHGCQVNGASV
jgi:hypothetical protein